VFVGGDFTFIKGVTRNNIAAVDNTTGQLTSWNPNSNGTVYSLLSDGSTVYAAGGFTNIGGQARNRLVALNITSDTAKAWNPNANGLVRTMILDGSTLYVGGIFSSVGGQTRNNIAALDTSSGLATTWNPNADNYVITLALDGSTVYAGGTFNNIGGQGRGNIAALDKTTGSATTWNPVADNIVFSIVPDGSTVYAGGYFTAIGGQARNMLAALDKTTGLATTWNPNPEGDGPVQALALEDSNLYVGGFFSTIGGQVRNSIAAVDKTTGLPTTWNPDEKAGGTVTVFDWAGGVLYVGGEGTRVGDVAQGLGFARFAYPAVQFAQASSTVPDSPTTTNLEVDLSAASYEDVEASYAVTGGTATLGQDFTLSGSSLSFPAFSNTGTIPITILDGSQAEPDETVEITLTNTSANADLGTPTVHTLTITGQGVAPTSNLIRIPGDTPQEQALNLSKRSFPTSGSAANGLLCRQDLIVDCFVAGPLNNLVSATMLLTDSNTLDPATLDELKRAVGADQDKSVYLIGGEEALSPSIASALESNGFKTKRLGGLDRYQTATLVAGEITTLNPTPTPGVFLSEASLFVDALSIGAIASQVSQDQQADSILLTNRAKPTLNSYTRDYLESHPELSELVLVGGSQALDASLETTLKQDFSNLSSVSRLSGPTRFETNLAILEHYFPSPTTAVFVNGETINLPGAELSATSASSGTNFFSALLAGDFAATQSAPLLIVKTDSLPAPIEQYLTTHAASITSAWIVGSLSQVSQAVEDSIETFL
ncbi:MAG: cell wall-binding repeat-containing protein, partial [Parcubacteria group bacterium]